MNKIKPVRYLVKTDRTNFECSSKLMAKSIGSYFETFKKSYEIVKV